MGGEARTENCFRAIWPLMRGGSALCQTAQRSRRRASGPFPNRFWPVTGINVVDEDPNEFRSALPLGSDRLAGTGSRPLSGYDPRPCAGNVLAEKSQ
jgi:hypothetical protein